MSDPLNDTQPLSIPVDVDQPTNGSSSGGESTPPRGRRADGAPRRKPGPRKGSPQRGGRPKTKPAAVDYRPGILGMFQLAAVPLALTQPLDAAAVSLHAPGIAEAVNDLAHDRPEVAAALERVLQVGPYGALLAAVLPLAVQLMHNHGALPESAAVQLGATPRRVLAAELGMPVDQDDQHDQGERSRSEQPAAA